jgi:Protein of unknown function (DUF1194)
MAMPLSIRHDRTERRKRAGLLLGALVLLAGLIAPISTSAQELAVDVELVLAVDVSPSMSQEEQRVQRNGYVSAFRDPDLARAIALGPHGMIAVLYLEWAGSGYQRVVVPWTIIGRYEDAKRFADTLASQPIAEKVGTSISGGLLKAAELLGHNWIAGGRVVIDVSGDGPNNDGLPVAPVRDKLVASGITINGLPITLPPGSSDIFDTFSKDYLDAYYEHCVVGGSEAFVIGIDDISQFESTIRRKLIREIAGVPSRPWLTAVADRSAFDCLTLGR